MITETAEVNNTHGYMSALLHEICQLLISSEVFNS